jgi:hypothetical protein
MHVMDPYDLFNISIYVSFSIYIFQKPPFNEVNLLD